MQIKDILDIKDLLQRFPGGFAVTPSGKILEVTANFQDPQKATEIKPPREGNNWGFLVVAVPLNLPGDTDKFEKKRISVQDFFKVYESQIYYEEEQLHQTIAKLNEIGVGLDYEYEVSYKQREEGGFSLVLLHPREELLAIEDNNGANHPKFGNT